MHYQLTIGWLYPDLMSTYGDRGNIIVLKKRCEWRNISVEVVKITPQTSPTTLKSVDLLFGGGAQDREQEIVMRDLKGKKGEIIKELIGNDTPALFVCGAPQLMGKYYEPSVGERIVGLGIFDMVSKHPGPHAKRLIGNTIAEVHWENLLNRHPEPFGHSERSEESQGKLREGSLKDSSPCTIWYGASPLAQNDKIIVGFENHGGRTYLGENAKPFAKVIKGYGNNGEDGTEGVVYRNAIGCYFHGPLLPKNPHIADFLIKRALEVKYKKEIDLKPLDDILEWKAHEAMIKKLS